MSNTPVRDSIRPSWRTKPEHAFVVFAITLVVTTLSFYLLFGAYFAAILLLSVFLHEVGHWTALQHMGFRARMAFIPFMGAFVSPYDQDIPRFNAAPRNHKALMILAGAGVNVLLAVLGTLMMRYEMHIVSYEVARDLAVINATLAGFNLIPIFGLDGDHMARLLFSGTASERQGAKAYDTIQTWSLLAILVSVFMFITDTNNGVALFEVLFLLALFYTFNRYKNNHPKVLHESAPLLTPAQSKFWATAWGVLLVASTFLLINAGVVDMWSKR